MSQAIFSSTQPTSDWMATVRGAVDKAVEGAVDTGKAYLADQWGLTNPGNGVDQNLYNPNPSIGNNGQAVVKPVGLIDLNLGANSMIILLVGGVLLYFVLK